MARLKLFLITFSVLLSLHAQAQDDSLKNIFSISDAALSRLRVIRKEWEKTDSLFRFAALFPKVKDFTGMLNIEIQDKERSLNLGYKEAWMKFFPTVEEYSAGLCQFIQRHPESFPGIGVCDFWATPFPVLSIQSFKALADSTPETEDNAFCNLYELAYGDFDDGTDINVNWKTKFFDGTCNAVILSDPGTILMLQLAENIRREAKELEKETNAITDAFAKECLTTKYFNEEAPLVTEKLLEYSAYFEYAPQTKTELLNLVRKIENDPPDIYFDAKGIGYTCE